MPTFIVKLSEVPSNLSHYPSYRDENKSWLTCFDVPGKWAICDCCHGEGQHCHSIDGNGLSREMQEDPDFMEEYMRGSYDKVCEVCKGNGKMVVPDEEKLNQDHERILYQLEEEDRSRFETDAIQAAERAMGA